MAFPFFLLILAAAAVLAFVAAGRAWRHRRELKPSGIGLALAALPAAVMVTGYYALAWHMRKSLGGWPESLGTLGFPPSLATHADFWFDYFGVLLVTIPVWLIVTAVALARLRWRRALPYCGVYGFAFFVCVAAFFLAPGRFISWWWD